MTTADLLRSRRRRYPWLAALAVFPVLLTSEVVAQAQSDQDESSRPAVPLATPLEGAPAPTSASEAVGVAGPAPSTPPEAPLLEHLGPDTFPGRSRGLPGGSLWLEPSFHGLQWPHNTRTGVGVSGLAWIDSGNEMIRREIKQLPNSNLYFQQGRGLLRVTPAYVRGSAFVQGQIELVGNLCQTANVTNTVCNAGTFSTDDLWIRFGQWNSWDLKVGRFEGWEVYHLGMGMEPYTLERLGAGMFGVDSPASPKLEAPSLYGLNYLRDRPTDGLAVGYAALHVYATEYLRFELLAKLGTDNYLNDNSTGATSATYLGGRPTAIFDVGWLKLKLGGEYQKRTPLSQALDAGQKKDAVEELIQKGVAGSLQIVIDPVVEFGVSGAVGQHDYTDSSGNGFGTPDTLAKSYTTKSIGGFANLRLAEGWLAGVGANWTTQSDSYLASGSTLNDFTSHLQSFAALQYLALGQLYVKAVFGFARADFLPSDASVPEWKNYMYSGRIRLMYLF